MTSISPSACAYRRWWASSAGTDPGSPVVAQVAAHHRRGRQVAGAEHRGQHVRGDVGPQVGVTGRCARPGGHPTRPGPAGRGLRSAGPAHTSATSVPQLSARRRATSSAARSAGEKPPPRSEGVTVAVHRVDLGAQVHPLHARRHGSVRGARARRGRGRAHELWNTTPWPPSG